MPIPTNILQSMLALNASEIDKLSIFLQSYKDLRNFQREAGQPTAAEKMQRLVNKTKEKIAKLARNQKVMKDQLNENTFNDYIDVLTYVYEG